MSRPLHSLADHKWDAQHVRLFFLLFVGAIIAWGAWGLSAWRNTRNVNNHDGAVALVVVFGIAFVVLTMVTLWYHEERAIRVNTDRDERIAKMEKEVFGNA